MCGGRFVSRGLLAISITMGLMDSQATWLWSFQDISFQLCIGNRLDKHVICFTGERKMRRDMFMQPFDYDRRWVMLKLVGKYGGPLRVFSGIWRIHSNHLSAQVVCSVGHIRFTSCFSVLERCNVLQPEQEDLCHASTSWREGLLQPDFIIITGHMRCACFFACSRGYCCVSQSPRCKEG